MRELVSIVICSYKNIEGIFETLDSIREQTYPNIEVIISDDGTPGFMNRIPEITEYIEKRPNHIKRFYINALKNNQGTVKNLNSGLQFAKGQFIMTPAPEDVFSTEFSVEHCVDYMEKHSFLIAFGKMRGITQNGEFKYQLDSCESDYHLLKSYSIQDTLNRMYSRNFLPGPAWIANRTLFEEYGYFDEDIRLIEDYPYWIHLCQNHVAFGYIDEIILDYKLSGVSSGGHYSQMFMEDMFKIYNKYIFPNDYRYGFLQKPYNGLKKAGLNYYMAEAKRGSNSVFINGFNRLRYLPFHLYVKISSIANNKKNSVFLKTAGDQ